MNPAYILIPALLIANLSLTAQVKNSHPVPKKVSHSAQSTENVFSKATFPGGDSVLKVYLSKNIHYPAIAEENNITGKVIVRFTIDEKGQVIAPLIIRGIYRECDEEALRVVKAMPVWKPFMYKGKPMPCPVILPVSFKLE